VELALHTSLERWGLVEAGARFGRVTTVARAGLDLPEGSDQVGALFGRLVVDTLGDLEWPDRGYRLAVSGEWSLCGLGAEREYWKAAAHLRRGRGLGPRVVGQLDLFAGFSGRDLAVYDWYRLGGVTLLPGYRHEELKGKQAFAGALSMRYRVLGELRVLARVGAGNVFEATGDFTLDGLRWGAAAGLYYPSPLGPVSLEIGVRDGGRTLTSLTVGWN
jgi:outer membrane protein assembly factor BamA